MRKPSREFRKFAASALVAAACALCVVSTINAASGNEIREWFAKNVYGAIPPKPRNLRFELVESGDAFDGLAERRQYKVSASDARGSLDFDVLVYLPKGAEHPAPAFVWPNFSGNHSLTDDPAVKIEEGWVFKGQSRARGERSDRVPVKRLLVRGFAFATFNYNAVYPDHAADRSHDSASESVYRIFDESSLVRPLLAHPAWSWGSMRVRDLLETIPEIDQRHVAIAGQSRMGKNAIVTGVYDDRFALVCANCGGTKSLKYLPNLLYPFWFSPNMQKYAMNGTTGLTLEQLEEQAAKMPDPPFDQDDFMGTIAPRALYVAAASEDKWSPPDASRKCVDKAQRHFDPCGKVIGWHVKEGPHSVTHYDWERYMDYALGTLGWKAARKCAIKACSTDPDRVESPLSVPMKRLGTLVARAKPIKGDRQWSISSTCLDRNFADFDQYKHLLAPLGIYDVRFQAGWAKCERVKGKFDFAWLDEQVDYCLANGLNPVLETSYGNPIYKGGGGWDLSGGIPSGEEGLAAWDRWIDALARHFKGRVTAWMMWNEPSNNAKNTSEIISAFDARTARIIKKHIPDASIGAFSFGGSRPKEFIECFEALGKDAELFDRYIYHGYSPNPDKSYEYVKVIKEIVAKYAPHAIAWQGENGAPSEMAQTFALSKTVWSEYSQAKWDLRRMLGDLGHDVPSAVFTFCDFYHVAPNSTAHRVEINRKGLLRANEDHEVIAIKRAFYSVQNCVTVFDPEARRVKDPSISTTDSSVALYEYDRKGLPIFVFWIGSEVPGDSFQTRPLSFYRKGSALRDPVWVDLMTGRVYEFPAKNQIVHSRGTAFIDVPVYDSPCLLTERAVLDICAKGN